MSKRKPKALERPDPPAFDSNSDAELFNKVVRTAHYDIATQRVIVRERGRDLAIAKDELRCREQRLERLLTEGTPDLFDAVEAQPA